ncbi:MAG: hypothetical protein CMO01_25410 [Thalassobius sp.]|nr:hypothetical protein [Thalassovita sp.]
MEKRIIIIGGLSAGPSAAAKARRTDANCEILLFEKTDKISTATCGIPYALSAKENKLDKLSVVDAELLRRRFNIEVYLNETVIDIDTTMREVITSSGRKYQYTELIFATGASAYTPPIKNIEKCNNWSHCKSITDLKKIYDDKVLETAEHITVLGSGLIGIEITENLCKAGKKVSLIELQDDVLPIWDTKFSKMAYNVLKEQGVDIRTGTIICGIDPTNREVQLNDGSIIKTDYLLVSVGLRPNTELLLAEGAEHLKNGALIVDEYMRTTLPHVYAAGDCASIKNQITNEHDYFPMGTHSNKGGRVAGANAAGGNEVFKGAYNTTIVKIFDYTLAKTGMTAKMLRSKNIAFESSFFVTTATPSFYPNPTDLFIEIFYSPDNKTILGAEIFGEKGVDKRIDVLSTCIYAKLKMDDLPQLDLAYAPPYSPAKDAVITSGFIGTRDIAKSIEDIDPVNLKLTLEELNADNQLFIDVRNPEELYKQGIIPGAKNYPLDELRLRLSSISKEKDIIVYCQKGLRGYVAALILKANGFKNVKNLAGGFITWKMLNAPTEAYLNGNGNGYKKIIKQDTNGLTIQKME